jgi:hypothetical protein
MWCWDATGIGAPVAGVGNTVDHNIKMIEVDAAIKEDAERSAGE